MCRHLRTVVAQLGYDLVFHPLGLGQGGPGFTLQSGFCKPYRGPHTSYDGKDAGRSRNILELFEDTLEMHIEDRDRLRAD